jgi:hypothetical protein
MLAFHELLFLDAEFNRDFSIGITFWLLAIGHCVQNARGIRARE